MTETVSCEIVLGDGRPWREHLPVLRLSWAESDPLAVVVVVGARPPHPALLRGRWVVLRDALRAVLAPDCGRTSPARAAGHVSMSRQDEHVTLTLRSASLPCVVTVPAGPMREFLTETDAIVPPGRESWAPALDAEIARMLHGD
jgi:Streptomyces sporulation and cell division protein, SsgA